MSSYSDYVLSASSSMMDVVLSSASSASSTAATVAGQVACSVSGVCQGVASSAQQKLLSYKYDARPLTCEDKPDYPETDSPVWMLGQQYSARYDLEELRELVTSRPWLSYRKEFPAIGESGLTSDQGWGCMLRCGQMVLAGALLDIKLGREWRWSKESKEKEYFKVMEKFMDIKSAQYSIHQISLMGESLDKKPVGTWFGPNTVAQVLRKLCKFDPSNDIAVHVAMDNTLVISEVKQACTIDTTEDNDEDDKSEEKVKTYNWQPLLLFISLRLGLNEINPVYIPGLKTCLTLPCTLGVIGGSPNHALYLLGYVEDEVIYLDPHTTQPAAPPANSEEDDMTYHAVKPGRIDISQLDPSLSLCFLCTTEEEFDNLCIAMQEQLIEKCRTPLFEMLLERPPHMYSQLTHGDINVQPDESTGMDYEQLNRKYDSEDEFEIL